MKSRKVVVMVILGALLLSACGSAVPSPSQEIPNPYPDNFAPAFDASTVSDEKISLTRLRGQTTVLNFWAMWCSPCRDEIPELNRFYESYRSKVTILSVEVDGQRNALTDFLQSTPIGFPIVLNAEQEADIAELYQIRAIPTTFIIGPDGKIIDRITGATTEEDLVRKVGLGPIP